MCGSFKAYLARDRKSNKLNSLYWLPFASLDKKDREILTATAQGILDARAMFSDSSLADLYNPLTMPQSLRKAHEKNDQAVLKIYSLSKTATPSDIVKELFTRYESLSKN